VSGRIGSRDRGLATRRPLSDGSNYAGKLNKASHAASGDGENKVAGATRAANIRGGGNFIDATPPCGVLSFFPAITQRAGFKGSDLLATSVAYMAAAR